MNQYATFNSDSGRSYFDGVIKIDSTCDNDAVDVELELLELGGGKAVSSTFSASSSEASVLNVVSQLFIQLFFVPIRIRDPLLRRLRIRQDKEILKALVKKGFGSFLYRFLWRHLHTKRRIGARESVG